MPYNVPNTAAPDTSGARDMWMALAGGLLTQAIKPKTPAGPYTPANSGGALPDFSSPMSSLYKPAGWVDQPMDLGERPYDWATWNQPGDALKYTPAGGYTAQPPPRQQGSSY